MPALYIHIPFCIKKCGYCDFYSSVQTGQTHEWLAALELEMRRFQDFSDAETYDTLYLGGGTPSLLDPDQTGRLFDAVESHFTFRSGAEKTMEVNPGTSLPERLDTALARGINRLSIGAQSFHEHELKLLDRIHEVGDIERTIRLARSAGVRNIGLDLIFGLPGQTLKAWENSLERAVEHRPEHLSAYALTWSEKTPMGRAIDSGRLPEPDDALVSDMFLLADNLLAENGYIHYEISNYAREGFECRHNRHYWDGTPYLGLGPSAHSFKQPDRWWNMAETGRYIAALRNGQSPVENLETLTDDQLALETAALGLRTNGGISTDQILDKTVIDTLVSHAYAFCKNDRMILTPEGMLLADEIALKLA